MGINSKGELGFGDNINRKSFVMIEELSDKVIEETAIGKNGFTIAISSLE